MMKKSIFFSIAMCTLIIFSALLGGCKESNDFSVEEKIEGEAVIDEDNVMENASSSYEE